jgi:hypothetical protein
VSNQFCPSWNLTPACLDIRNFGQIFAAQQPAITRAHETFNESQAHSGKSKLAKGRVLGVGLIALLGGSYGLKLPTDCTTDIAIRFYTV